MSLLVPASTSSVVAVTVVSCGVYGVVSLIETSIHPYDILEAEPEVVSGYYVDYGGYVFMLIYLAEGIAILWHSMVPCR